MELSGRIRNAIAARNREIAMEAAVEAGLGVLFSALIFGFVFVVAWLALVFFARGFFDWTRTAWLAAAIAGAYALVATISAWRAVNPLENVRKLTDFEERMLILSPMLPFGIGMQPRHALAGFATVLIAGPANLFEAWATWRRRLPRDAGVADKAATVLQQAEREADPETIADPVAALVLHRLGMVKLVGVRDKRVGLTEKGRRLLHGVETE